jgi:putative transposase
VDSLGHILAVHVHAANRHDNIAGPVVIVRALIKYPTITMLSGDAGYRGTTVNVIKMLTTKSVKIVEKLSSGWSILPKNCIFERNFAWINTRKRLTRDFEIKPKKSENVIRIAAKSIYNMIRKINYLNSL